MYKVQDISFAALGGAAIGVTSLLGNIIRLGYVWDQILIPLMFLGFKWKRKSMPMIWPAVVACVILSGYKFYLGFFIIAYYLIAKTVYKMGHKINLKSILIISFVYVISYFGAWFIIAYFIHSIKFEKIVFQQLTGGRFQNKFIVAFLIISEPIVFSIFYQNMFGWVKRRKVFND